MKTFTPNDRSEVDMRVAQEIKNHKDLMYDANQRMNNIKNHLDVLYAKQDLYSNKSANDCKSLLIDFENLKEGIDKAFKEMSQKLGDAETKLFKVLDEFTDLREETESQCLTREEFINVFDPQETRIDELERKITQKCDYLNNSLISLRHQFEERLKQVQKELQPIPPEIDKAYLEEKFSILRVDFEGLVREIALLKKSTHYDQKKFENIYTLIERLKAGKQ